MAGHDRALRRLTRELAQIEKLQAENNDLGWSAGPVDDADLFNWRGFLFGPSESPFEGGLFEFTIKFTTEYPIKPPRVKFLNVPFHPNVYTGGDICLDILQSEWTPALQINTMLQSIRSLLTDPNIASPANSQAAALYQQNRAAYDARVRASVAGGGGGGGGGALSAGAVVDDDAMDEDEESSYSG